MSSGVLQGSLSPSLREDIEAASDERLRQLQLHLLTTSAIIEGKIRSWHPGAEWTREEVEALKAEQQKREDLAALLLDLLLAQTDDGPT